MLHHFYYFYIQLLYSAARFASQLISAPLSLCLSLEPSIESGANGSTSSLLPHVTPLLVRMPTLGPVQLQTMSPQGMHATLKRVLCYFEEGGVVLKEGGLVL